MTEAYLKRKIKDALKKKFPGTYFFTAGTHRAGLPDILGCVNGRLVGLEVKLPGKETTLTKLQSHTGQQLAQAGAYWAMVTSVAIAVAHIDTVLMQHPKVN